MWQAIFRPIFQRLATIAGTWFATIGMVGTDIDTLTAAIPIMGGLLVDLVQRRFY